MDVSTDRKLLSSRHLDLNHRRKALDVGEEVEKHLERVLLVQDLLIFVLLDQLHHELLGDSLLEMWSLVGVLNGHRVDINRFANAFLVMIH